LIPDFQFYFKVRCDDCSQGEDTQETRVFTDRVHIDQIPNLMRALGFYPCEAEIDAMMNEVKFDRTLSTGEVAETIQFHDFMKCK
jgi:Ca2+-binding EF-hand superfamily protein